MHELVKLHDLHEWREEARDVSENEERALFLLARGQVKRDREMIRQLVKIRKSRESEGLTQKEVAARMGSDQGFVSRFESLETNPNLRTIRAYALAVGAEINYEVYPANCASLTQPSTDSAVPGLTTAPKMSPTAAVSDAPDDTPAPAAMAVSPTLTPLETLSYQVSTSGYQEDPHSYQSQPWPKFTIQSVPAGFQCLREV